MPRQGIFPKVRRFGSCGIVFPALTLRRRLCRSPLTCGNGFLYRIFFKCSSHQRQRCVAILCRSVVEFLFSTLDMGDLYTATGKLDKARSRLSRSQILQINTLVKALAEIYSMHSFAPLSNLNLLSNVFDFFQNVRKFCQSVAEFCLILTIVFRKFAKMQLRPWRLITA